MQDCLCGGAFLFSLEITAKRHKKAPLIAFANSGVF
jgi:hypothetical protein